MQYEDEVRTARGKALAMLPILRKRDEGGKIVKINDRTWIIKRKKQ